MALAEANAAVDVQRVEVVEVTQEGPEAAEVVVSAVECKEEWSPGVDHKARVRPAEEGVPRTPEGVSQSVCDLRSAYMVRHCFLILELLLLIVTASQLGTYVLANTVTYLECLGYEGNILKL